MSIYRGPSAEDHHVSPAADNKITTSTANAPTTEEPIPTRKCCTLCNLLVSSIDILLSC